MYTDEDVYGLFLLTGFIFLKVICYYWAVDFFHCYFNQMPKSLSYGSYFLMIEKDCENRLNYLDASLSELIEKSDILN